VTKPSIASIVAPSWRSMLSLIPPSLGRFTFALRVVGATLLLQE
jgi:hypothetical protein